MTNGRIEESLFTTDDYVQPMAVHGCLGAAQGWHPLDVKLADGAHAPAYLKNHSWGEFVFDFHLARAYEQQGLAYYPKVVSCVPFTPVPGPRLLAADDHGRAQLATALIDAARTAQASSAHVLYPSAADSAVLSELGWLQREQLRYVWDNRGYADVEAFVAALSAKRRKNLRRERRQIAEAGYQIGWHAAAQLTQDERATVYALYAHTYHQRGQAPYLTAACFEAWAQRLGDRLQVCAARQHGQILAMAFYFVDGTRLCGRHWGARVDAPLLHFELCYYQGIDYAITQRMTQFDAGVQGEHKLLRGFDPICVPSFHWFAHAGFARALTDHFAQERAAIRAECVALAAHSAYRAG